MTHFSKSKNNCSKIVFIVILFQFVTNTFSQNTVKDTISIKTSVGVTNNGLALIPSFSLGKPAVLFNASIGGKKLSFDPEFRFSLEGKPLSFVFIWRYKLVQTNKFQFAAGAHLPGLSFSSSTVLNNGVSQSTIEARRILGLELVPNYSITKNIGIGMYYLYGRGLDAGFPTNTNFFVLRASFSKINFSDDFYLSFNPQVYYLNMDKTDGYYFSSNLTLAKRNFPFSISTMMYKTIKTDIVGKTFDWNVSLIYSLNKKFVKQ